MCSAPMTARYWQRGAQHLESKSKVNPEISSEDAAPTEVVFGDDGGDDEKTVAVLDFTAIFQ